MATAWVYMQDKESGEVRRTTCPEFWKERVRLERKHGESLFVAQERTWLIRYLQSASVQSGEGAKRAVTVYAIVRSVASSGMQKTVDLYLHQEYGIQKITATVANAAQMTLNRHDHLVLRGGNTDVIHDLVSELMYALRLNESMTFHTYIL